MLMDGWVRPVDFPPCSSPTAHGALPSEPFGSQAEIDQRVPFWQSHLAGAQRLWTAPVDSEAMSSPLQAIGFAHLPANLGRAARELARRNGTTLFSTLLAAFRIALSRWTGATDIVVGTPVANRNKQAVRETMGYCAGIVPLRGRVEHDRPFSDSLRAVHQDIA